MVFKKSYQTKTKPNMPTFGVTSAGNNVITQGSFKGIAKGETVNYDLHAWCEDEEGNILYDPWFPEFDLIVAANKCNDENDSMEDFLVERNGRIYKKRPEWQPIVNAVMKRSVSLMMADGIAVSDAAFKVPARYGCCVYNAYFWKLRNPTKNAKLCVGQMGWKTKSGGEHWEYG